MHTGAATGRVLAASLDDVMGQAYVRTAKGKGVPERRVLWVHALPNALIPVVTYFSTEAGRLLGGAVLTETVFAINGIGRYLVSSIVFPRLSGRGRHRLFHRRRCHFYERRL